MRASLLLFVSTAAASIAIALATACSTSSAAAAGDAGVDAGPVHHANGTLGAWQTLAPMPVARGNHCSVVANGYLVVIGGNFSSGGSFKNTDEIDVAKIASDGSLGPWTNAGKTPSPVNSCTAAADGARIFLIDGIYDDMSLEGTPQVATLGDDGTLGGWTRTTPLPTGVDVFYSTAVVSNDVLYTMFVRLPEDGDSVSLLTAPLDVNGIKGPYVESKWLPGFRGHPAVAFAPPYVYAIGGYNSIPDAGNMVVATGSGAAVDPSGAAGSAFSIASLPSPRTSSTGIAVDSYFFVIGGKSDILSGAGVPDVLAGAIDASGKIASFTKVADMPQGRVSLAAAVGGDFLYVTGGGFQAGGLDTVFAAQVRF